MKKKSLTTLADLAYSYNLNKCILYTGSRHFVAAACPVFSLPERTFCGQSLDLGFCVVNVWFYLPCCKVSLGKFGCRCQCTNFSFLITGPGSSFHSQQNYILYDLCFFQFASTFKPMSLAPPKQMPEGSIHKPSQPLSAAFIRCFQYFITRIFLSGESGLGVEDTALSGTWFCRPWDANTRSGQLALKGRQAVHISPRGSGSWGFCLPA